MNSRLKNFILILVLGISFGFFAVGTIYVYAQEDEAGDGSANQENLPPTPTPSVTQINLNLVNPIASGVNSIPQFFQKVVDIIIKIAIPFVAIVLVYCGLLFVTARGDTAQLDKARNAFTYAVIGGLVLLASWLIAEAIRDALTTLAYVL